MFDNNVSIIAAFVAGFLLFFTPCVLPLIPAYLGYISGISFSESKSQDRLKVVRHALFFVLGFSLVFVVLGASVGFVGFVVTDKITFLRYVFGGLLIVFGLFMIGILKIPFLMREWRIPDFAGKKVSYFRSLFVGIAFALAWTPCIGPVLGAILTFAYQSDTAFKGALLLSVFSLGLGIPFLISAFFIERILGLFKKLKKYTRIIEVFTGSFLVFLGVLVMTNYFEKLNSMLPYSDFSWF